jgi:hypothetical protein
MTDHLERIDFTDPITLPRWETDAFTGRILHDENGAPVRAKLRIDEEIMVIHDAGPGWALVERGVS